MKRVVRWTLTACATIVALAGLCIVVLITFDWNKAKPWVTRNVSDALGRSIAIDGDLSVHWYRDAGLDGWRAWIPSPHVFAADVTVGNSAWARTPRFGHADTIEFDFELLPLLAHRVSIQLMRFINPDAALERLDDDRENWTFTDKPSSWTCSIGRISIDRATFTYLDHPRHIDVAGKIEALDTDIAFDALVSEQVRQARQEVLAKIGPKAVQRFEERADRRAELSPRRDGRSPQHYSFAWTASGKFANEPFRGSGKLGGMYYLRNPEHPFPLLADTRIGDTHIVLLGTLTDPADVDAVDLRLWLAGRNLSQLYDIARLALPNTPPYAMEGRLAGRFPPDGTELDYQDFTARIGQSDLTGTLRYRERKPRSLLSGKVVSEELQFRDLAPLIGASSTPDKQGKLLPETPFRPERWRVLDADVEFSADHLFRDSQLPVHQVDTRIAMNDAVLSLAPLKFRYADGDVTANLRFDGTSAPIRGSFELKARGMQLNELFPLGNNKQLSLGRADGEAKLAARGESVGALLGAADGDVKLLLDNGTVSKALLETAGLNLPNILATKLFGDRQVKIDCAAADLVAQHGVFDARLFVIDTDVARIDITGTINLHDETVDLVVNPKSKGVRLLSLRSPLHLHGPLANIDVSVDKGALLKRAAAALGLAALTAPAAALVPLTSTDVKASANRCEPLLAPPKTSDTPHS